MTKSDRAQPDPLSKTQVKKEMHSLQALGKKLIELSETELLVLELPNKLLEAIQFAHTIKSHEAIRRHLQYVGKIMREIDTEEILIKLKKIQYTKTKENEQFHATEAWRDRLIKEGDTALQEILNQYPQMDRQHLRQLVRKGQQDLTQNKNTGAHKELFQYLRDFII